MIVYYFLAALAGIFNLSHTALNKRILQKYSSFELMSKISVAFAILTSIIAMIYWQTNGWPKVTTGFWIPSIASAFILITAAVLYFNSIGKTELSVVAPILSLYPAFTIAFSWIISGEKTSATGIVGILMAILGIYILNIKENVNILAPIKEIFTNYGQRMMLMVAIVFGLSPTLDKIAISSSNPLDYTIIASWIRLVITILLVIIISKRKKFINTLFYYQKNTDLKLVLFVAGLQILEWISQMTALGHIHAPYMGAIKNFSIVLGGPIVGMIVFKEKKTSQKIIAAALAATGAAIVSLAR